MKTIVLLLLAAVVNSSAEPDCVDAQRTLRCVLPSNCPPKNVFNNRCPVGRICCAKDRSNPYLPLRRTPLLSGFHLPSYGRSLYTSTTTTTEKAREPGFDKDRIIFPEELDDTSSYADFRIENEENFVLPDEEPLNIKMKKQDWKDLRKSERYCREYTKLTIDVGYATPLLTKLIPLRYEMENCDPSFNSLVVGGSDAPISDFPHMVALGFNRSGDDSTDYLCGGSLISDEFVLTAAHCVETKWGAPVEARLGATNLKSDKGQKVGIIETFVHPGYQSSSCYNDIALIRLSRKIKLTPKLRPACLATDKTTAQFPNRVVVATGWGKTGFAREVSPTLQKVALKVVDNRKCGEYYDADGLTARLNKGITSDMICATGSTERSQDTCQGDSGGPLQSYLVDNRCVLQIVGITSFGKSCGIGVPGVYTRVSRFLTWIENIVWP